MWWADIVLALAAAGRAVLQLTLSPGLHTCCAEGRASPIAGDRAVVGGVVGCVTVWADTPGVAPAHAGTNCIIEPVMAMGSTLQRTIWDICPSRRPMGKLGQRGLQADGLMAKSSKDRA